MNVGMAEPEWNNNEVGQEEREDLSKGREKCAPLSLIFPGQCFCFRSSPPTYALLIPAVQSQFELCKRINSFDSWMGHSPRRVQKVVDTAVKRPIIKGIYDRIFSQTLLRFRLVMQVHKSRRDRCLLHNRPSSNWRPILRLAFQI